MRPRVLHVLEASGFGTGRHVADLIRHVSGVTHAVAIPQRRRADGSAASGPRVVGDLESEAEELGADVFHLPMDRFPLHPGNALALRRLRRIVRDWRPDLVHGHSSVGGALARLAAPLYAPVVYTPNGLHPSRYAIRLERWLGARTSVLVAVSDSEARDAIVRRMAPSSHVRVIVNGIEAVDDAPLNMGLRSLALIEPETFAVAFVGRLAEQKDPMTFVTALGLLADRGDLDDTSALLVGSGPLGGAVRRAVASQGLGDRVQIFDHVPDVARRLADVDILVSTSRWEGAPYVPLEAMRAGVPLVLSRCTGNTDLLEGAEVGLSFDVEDAEGLARCIAVLRNDPVRRQSLGENGRRVVRERYSVRQQASETAALYAELATSSSAVR